MKTRKIRNHRALLEKARTHKVVWKNETTYSSCYLVASGNSGQRYEVVVKEKFGLARCDCDWGRQGGYRKLSECACSHVLKVFAGREARKGRTIQTWNESEDAERQHRPVLEIGNGVWLTSRLATS